MKPLPHTLARAPFFEVFEEEDLLALSAQARSVSYEEGEVILTQETEAASLFILLEGRVRLVYLARGGKAEVAVRRIEEPGRVLGWSALVMPYRYQATIMAEGPVHALELPRDPVLRHAEAKPEFGVHLMRRVLWLVGNRLRDSRQRVITRRYDRELHRLEDLLNDHRARLGPASPLHKIPHYLRSDLNLTDAFQTLELLQHHGEALERELAGPVLDILADIRTELAFLQALQRLDRAADPAARREASRELFATTHYTIEGRDALPNNGACIYLVHRTPLHPDSTLPGKPPLPLAACFCADVALEDTDPPLPLVEGPGDLEKARAALAAGTSVVVTGKAGREDGFRHAGAMLEGAAGGTPHLSCIPVTTRHFDRKLTHAELSARMGPPVDGPVSSGESGDVLRRVREQMENGEA